MHNKENEGGGWLAPVLRRELQRVQAPPELWDRIALPREEYPQLSSRNRFVWMIAVASAVAASVLAIVWGYNPAHAGTVSPGLRVEFRSNHVADVRNWVRNRTGVDIPLPDDAGGRVQLQGAAITAEGRIEIRYRAGNQGATLVVAASDGTQPEHGHLTVSSLVESTRASWSMGQQQYTLAVDRAGNMRSACVVCHAEMSL